MRADYFIKENIFDEQTPRRLLRLRGVSIYAFEPSSLVDFPGHVCTTVFFHGCQLRCRYCHNPHLVIKPDFVNCYDEFYNFIIKNNVGAVALTGGEPLLSKNCTKIIEWLKSGGLDVKLDTNGGIPLRLHEVLKNNGVDYVAMDIKGADEKDYREITRVSGIFEKICQSVSVIRQSGVKHEYRFTMWKGYSEEEVANFREILGDSSVYLQYLNTDVKILDKSFKTDVKTVEIDQQVQLFKKYFSFVKARGLF